MKKAKSQFLTIGEKSYFLLFFFAFERFDPESELLLNCETRASSLQVGYIAEISVYSYHRHSLREKLCQFF